MIELVRGIFAKDKNQLAELDRAISLADNPYQKAFKFLYARRGPDVANKIIWEAVLSARQPPLAQRAINKLTENDLPGLDKDILGWSLSPGVRGLGEIIANAPEIYTSVITSNFDPLIEVSINKAGGNACSTLLHGDGNLGQLRADGCHVIHMHGYWHSFDTLHTASQLGQKRPALQASLFNLIKNKTIVVMAYGGWSDVFTKTLASLVSDQSSFPDVLWTFHNKNPRVDKKLKKILRPGLDRGRVTFYHEIDCHKFLPKLAAKLRQKQRNTYVSSSRHSLHHP